MKGVDFWKLQASGNDFILIDNSKSKIKNSKLKEFARKHCRRNLGAGADGLLVIEPSQRAAFRMRIFNADGSEAEMCGNGARCVALWAKPNNLKFQTKAGIIQARKKGKRIMIKLTDPVGLRLDMALSVLKRKLKVNFINTGVPHVVVFVEDVDAIDVGKIGSNIRFHKRFSPAGANVNFVELTGDKSIKLRTFERGVDGETLACGTGMTASAIISNLKLFKKNGPIKVRVLNKSREVINIYFQRENNKISDVWLEGFAYLIYKGRLYD